MHDFATFDVSYEIVVTTDRLQKNNESLCSLKLREIRGLLTPRVVLTVGEKRLEE